ncbi:MAG: putative Ig domain-containing protein [Bacteroidales bacterium]
MKIAKLLGGFLLLLLLTMKGVAIQAQTKIEGAVLTSSYSLKEFKGNLYLFGSSQTESNVSKIYKSSDGINWTTAAEGDLNLKPFAAGEVFKGKLYSIGGHADIDVSNEVISSEDGIIWTTQVASFSPRKKMGSCVHNNKLFVAGGSGLNDVWFTENGKDWTKACDKISDKFPHFWNPKLVSLNGSLVLFGGHKTDWGFNDNERNVFISNDDGKTWQENTIPFQINLDECWTYFVYNDQLYVLANNDGNSKHDQGNIFLSKAKFFVTKDGVKWDELAYTDLPIIKNKGVISKSVVYKGKIVNLSQNPQTYTNNYVEFQDPKIFIQNIENVFYYEDAVKDIELPFTCNYINSSDSEGISVDLQSSNPQVVSCDGLEYGNGIISISPRNKTGKTIITITATDGTDSAISSFEVYVFPKEKINLNVAKGYLFKSGSEDVSSKFSLIKAKGFGDVTFNVKSSSNSSFIDATKVTVGNLISTIYYIDCNDAMLSTTGQSKIVIEATDGINTKLFPIWIKVGDNQEPEVKNPLSEVKWDTKTPFAYNLPINTFEDSEGDELEYSAEDLPCGFTIDEKTGNISGETNELPPFDIKIIASDSYGASVSAMLKVKKEESTSVIDVNKIENLNVYPNPSKGQINIKSEENIKSVELWSVTGTLIQSWTSDKKMMILDLNYPKGLYILKIIQEDQASSLKLMLD